MPAARSWVGTGLCHPVVGLRELCPLRLLQQEEQAVVFFFFFLAREPQESCVQLLAAHSCGPLPPTMEGPGISPLKSPAAQGKALQPRRDLGFANLVYILRWGGARMIRHFPGEAGPAQGQLLFGTPHYCCALHCHSEPLGLWSPGPLM